MGLTQRKRPRLPILRKASPSSAIGSFGLWGEAARWCQRYLYQKVLYNASGIKREQSSPQQTNESVKAKIDAANRLIRGWCQYYRVTSSRQDPFSHLRRELFGRWHTGSVGNTRSVCLKSCRYRINNTLGTKTVQLVMPTAFKAKRLRTKPWHNPYTEKERPLYAKSSSPMSPLDRQRRQAGMERPAGGGHPH